MKKTIVKKGIEGEHNRIKLGKEPIEKIMDMEKKVVKVKEQRECKESNWGERKEKI